MTKSTGVGRGGHRPGAGRKAAPKQAKAPKSEVPATAANVDDVEALARSYTAVAVQTLVDIALNGEKEAARVAAANSLLDRGHGKAAGTGSAPQGKKAEQQASAEKVAQSSRFAPPSAPKLAVDNTR